MPDMDIGGKATGEFDANKVVVYEHANDKHLSCLTYIRNAKKQKHYKWTEQDKDKFYDAIKVFGGSMDYIFTLVFCPDLAKPRYYNPEDF